MPDLGGARVQRGKGPFHEIWEYTPRALGFRSHWEEDPLDGWDGAWAKLRGLIDRGLPVQVGTHYSLILPYGAATSPRLAFMHHVRSGPGFGHHIVIAGYDLDRDTVTVYLAERHPAARAVHLSDPGLPPCAGGVGPARGRPLRPVASHYQFGGEWSLHDGYGPYQMTWVEPGRDLGWDVAASIRDSFRRNLKILAGEYPKPYAAFANQWQIPRWETGAPGIARCAERSGPAA